MKITRDVIIDLLPLYSAGEVSDDTRRLVREFLEGDADLAREAEKFTRTSLSITDVPPALTAEDELQTLNKTKRLLAFRSFLLGFAIFFSLMPASFAVIDGEFRWLVAESPPSVAVYAAVAVICWTGYLMLRRNLRPTGL